MQQEYQTTDPTQETITENNSKIQTQLIFDTNLSPRITGGWEGVIKCDMEQLGFFRVRDGGQGNQFTIRACMYNFRNQAMSEFPSINLSLSFR